MSPTDQERLAALETQMQQVHEDISAIRVATEKLLSMALMGRGALWLALHIGTALGILATAYEALRSAWKN
jgi:6-phosphofructokinase